MSIDINNSDSVTVNNKEIYSFYNVRVRVLDMTLSL